jgi:hypothetical protein
MFFAMQLARFTPGAKLDVVHGSFRSIGFGGSASVVKFDAEHLELELRVTKLLFHIDVVLRFEPDGEGNVSFFGGRADGKKTGSEPAHVKHLMTVKSRTPERTLLEFEMIENDQPVIKQLVVEKTYVDGGVEALRLTYDRFELALAPSASQGANR